MPESIFNKVAGLRPATLLKRKFGAGVFLWILLNFYEHFWWLLLGHIDVLIISESKLGNSFLDGLFLIEDYGARFWLDGNKFGSSIMTFVRSDVSVELLSVDIGFKSFFVELNFRKKKWLLNCSYYPKGDFTLDRM